MNNILLVIITALISGLLATIVTIIWQRKSATFNRKLHVFETLMSYRYMISAEESVKALNTVDIIFYKDSAVRKAYSDFLNETDKKPEFNPQIGDKHLKLLEEMAKALKLKNIHWDEIKHSYYPTGLSQKISEEATLRKMQIQSAAVALNNEQQQNTPAKNQFAEQLAVQLLPELIKNPESLKGLLNLAEQFGAKKHES